MTTVRMDIVMTLVATASAVVSIGCYIAYRSIRDSVTPFWATFQTILAAALHNPSVRSADMDRLLEGLEGMCLSPHEKLRLVLKLEDLKQTANRDIADKAGLLLQIIPLVEKEFAGDFPPTDRRSIAEKKKLPHEP